MIKTISLWISSQGGGGEMNSSGYHSMSGICNMKHYVVTWFDIVSIKIYDKRADFDFEIVNFPFLDGDVPRSTSYRVYISQLIGFARASSYVVDFNTRNKLLIQKLFKQGYQYHKLGKAFSKFYRRYYDLISKFQVRLKSLFRQGLSEPDFYGDLVYKLKKIVGSNNFSAKFIKMIFSIIKRLAITLMYCSRLHAWW